jgi:hypothetical protein
MDMEEKIKKINLKTFSVIGIILSIGLLILFFWQPSGPEKEFDWIDTIYSLLALFFIIFLFLFSILNLYRPRKSLSIVGIVLAILNLIFFVIESFRGYSQPSPFNVRDLIAGVLYLISIFYLGFFAIVSLFKSIYEPAEIQKPESKIEKIIKKVLWTLVALFLGISVSLIIQASLDLYVHLAIPDYPSFYKNPPQWYFQWRTILSWIGVIFCWLIIIFITYKKIGILATKIFSTIFLIIFFSLFMRTFFFETTLLNVPPDSEFTFIPDNTYALVDKISYRIRQPKVGELVIYREEGTIKIAFGRVSSSKVHQVYPTSREGIYTGASIFIPKENIIGKLLVGKIIYVGTQPISIYFFTIFLPLTILIFIFAIFLSHYIFRKIIKTSANKGQKEIIT